jgi:hypothetical protein
MGSMEPIIWLSFDDTLPVPALASRFALPRESVTDLFHRGRELTQLQWKKDRVLIRPEDQDTREDSEEVPRIEIEGVEFYDFTGSIFEFNRDDEQMAELGYRANFVPGGGIVVDNPATPVTLAADRIWEDLRVIFGVYAPERLNSWAEYASQVPNLDRVFALSGVERHEKEKQAAVAARMDVWLSERARQADITNTARADELAVGDVLEDVDVRWWSHSPNRVLYTVSAVEPTEGGKLTISFTSENDRDRVLTVPADRRFLKSGKGQ